MSRVSARFGIGATRRPSFPSVTCLLLSHEYPKLIDDDQASVTWVASAREMIVKTRRGTSALKKIHSRLEGRSPFGIGRRVFRQTPVRDKRRECLIDKQVFTEEIIRRYFERACVRERVRARVHADAGDGASVREKNLPDHDRSTRAFVCPPPRVVKRMRVYL